VLARSKTNRKIRVIPSPDGEPIGCNGAGSAVETTVSKHALKDGRSILITTKATALASPALVAVELTLDCGPLNKKRK